MNFSPYILIVLFTVISPVMAGTVVITSLPDESNPLVPLTSLGGVALGSSVEVKVGAFPGLSDDAILDAAATGGFSQLATAFQPFGSVQGIGDGVDGAAGNFEISVRQATPNPTSPWVGEEVSLLITKDGGQEFLVARFKGKLFEVDPDTGLEPLLSLHLADAKVIVGNRYGLGAIATSPAPESGSFSTWIASFPAITDPDKRLPDADADGDGRNNFLEYATGGDPGSAADAKPCQFLADEEGDFWIRFSRATGIGGVSHQIETSGDLISPWLPLDGVIVPDLEPPASAGMNWMKIRVPQPVGQNGFFRLSAKSAP
jgi:hypothetical protein